jgi:plastocyanin
MTELIAEKASAAVDHACHRAGARPSRISGDNLEVSGPTKWVGPTKVRVTRPLVALAAWIAVSATGFAADTVDISQRGRKFTPDTLRVTLGTTLRIANDDRVTHHIYIDQPEMKFDSGEQPVSKEVILRFDREGKFAVRCAIHPMMRLDVTVVPAD